MKKINRYSLIKGNFPREMLLLVGTGCMWKKCTFCDYYDDVCVDPFSINRQVIKKITGKTGVLDVINSGSCFELDGKTLEFLRKTAFECGVHTIWFEAHWLYHKKLDEFRNIFPEFTIKFRTGIETFDPIIRQTWNKGVPNSVCAEDVAKFFDGVCLLVGIKGQSKESILRDVDTALSLFEYFSINVFNRNSTEVERDEELIRWFKDTVVPMYCSNNKVEILIHNYDLGVG